MLSLEMLLMAMVGLFSGILGSLPVINFLKNNPIEFHGEGAQLFEAYGFDPIMPAIFDPGYFIGQTTVVLVLFLISAVYPLNWVMKLKEIKALRT